MRLPRAGGLVRAVAYPALDSVVWTAPVAAPAAERVLAFDENVYIVAEDTVLTTS